MPVLRRRDIGSHAGGRSPSLVVVALCAAWCDVCREFGLAYERLASAHPSAVFVWLDIEDDADLCGDVDVENFPTLAVYRGGAVLHFGTTLPVEAGVGRLIAALAQRPTPVRAGDEIVELGDRLLSLLGIADP